MRSCPICYTNFIYKTGELLGSKPAWSERERWLVDVYYATLLAPQPPVSSVPRNVCYTRICNGLFMDLDSEHLQRVDLGDSKEGCRPDGRESDYLLPKGLTSTASPDGELSGGKTVTVSREAIAQPTDSLLQSNDHVDRIESRLDDGKNDKPLSGKRSPISDIESLAPDGGYGWVVVVASFYVAFLFGLFLDGFSVLYVEIEDYFSTSKAYTGWIGSLSLSTGRLLGKWTAYLDS